MSPRPPWLRKFRKRAFGLSICGMGLLVLVPKVLSQEAEYASEVNRLYRRGADLRNEGKYRAAEIQFRAVIAFATQMRGPENVDTVILRHNLANALFAQGKLDAAEQELLTVVALRTRVFGSEDGGTLLSRERLAAVHSTQGKTVEAEAEYRSVLADSLRALRPGHQVIRDICYGLARNLKRQKKIAEAREFAHLAYEGGEEELGKGHPTLKRYEKFWLGLLPPKERKKEEMLILTEAKEPKRQEPKEEVRTGGGLQ